MWQLSTDSSSVTGVIGLVAGGVLSVVAAVASGLLALRGSARNTDAERERNFDERVDAEMALLRAENTAMRAKLDRARYELIKRRIDPSILD